MMYWGTSLKTRVALTMSALFIFFAALLAFFSLTYFQNEFRKSIHGQQFSIVSTLADEIDTKLSLAHNALIAVAANMPRGAARDRKSAQLFLEKRFALRSMFTTSLFVFSPNGSLLAEVPRLPERKTWDFSSREYYKKTVESGKPQIYGPFLITNPPNHPAIMLTAPVLDTDGRLVAILGGSFDLLGENFLKDLAAIRINRTGYLALFNIDRTVLMHPDQGYIMKRPIAAGMDMLFDNAVAGYEGSGETRDLNGISMITSFKRLRSTKWILSANYPVDDAYSPLYHAQLYFLLSVALGTVTALATSWFRMKQITAPLLRFTSHVETLPEKSGENRFITFETKDEIGAMANTFNAMIAKLDRQAYYDSLTNLPNRALLQDRLGQALAHASRDNRRLGILFLDIDRFKGINDSLGHVAGDLLLVEIAGCLRGCVRESDTVARHGGDEFIIVLWGIECDEDLSKLAKKILKSLEVPHVVNGQEMYVTASIGISVFPNDGKDLDTLLKNADAAMYKAKEEGRNNYQFFSEELNSTAMERLMLEVNLRRGLERSELLLYYQPQVELQGGKLVGMEALVRWQHPERGMISPMKFIPLAEETGLINQIGDWVLRTACETLNTLRREGFENLRMSVNLSSIQIRQRNFVAHVKDILAETGVDPGFIELELTESALMANADEMITELGKLKDIGISLAVDDFGTGYSSLSYLKLFPIDRLKIDRSFITDVTTNPNDSAITEAIIAIGQRMGLKVIAEGVETAEQLTYLRHLGCNEAQGYFMCRPVPLDELRQLLPRCLKTEAPTPP